MTTQADYSADEWNLLLQAPAVAALFVIQAEPYQPRLAIQKLFAALEAITACVPPSSDSELIERVVAAARAGQAPRWPSTYPRNMYIARFWAFDACRQVASLLAQKAPQGEASAFSRWLLGVSLRVALTADSAGEPGAYIALAGPARRALEQLAVALDLPPGALGELAVGQPV